VELSLPPPPSLVLKKNRQEAKGKREQPKRGRGVLQKGKRARGKSHKARANSP